MASKNQTKFEFEGLVGSNPVEVRFPPRHRRKGIMSSVAQHRPAMSYAQGGGGFDDADDALVADSEHRCSLSFAQVRGGLVCGL